MIRLFFMCLFLFSCAHSVPVEKADNGQSIYVCGQVNYLFHYLIPVDKIIVMNEAFVYWNSVLGKEVFSNQNKGLAHVYVGIDPKYSFSERWAHTNGKLDENGCITTIVMDFNPDVLNLSNSELQTAVRHEIGHVLSLGEDLRSVQVMLPQLPVHPLPPSQDQVDYIKKNVLR